MSAVASSSRSSPLNSSPSEISMWNDVTLLLTPIPFHETLLLFRISTLSFAGRLEFAVRTVSLLLACSALSQQPQAAPG